MKNKARMIVLAAGMGKRLSPLSDDRPKCMVEYKNKKIIDYLFQTAQDCDIDDISIVGGYFASVLREYTKPFVRRFYENPDYQTTNMLATFFCAREFLESCIEEEYDLIVSYTDIIYHPYILQTLIDFNGDFGIIVDRQWKELWEKRFEDPLSDAETLQIFCNKIIEIGKKPKNYNQIQGQYIGLFKFSFSFLKDVLKLYDKLDRNILYDYQSFNQMYMTSFLQELIAEFNNAIPVFIDGGWHEIDHLKDLEIEF